MKHSLRLMTLAAVATLMFAACSTAGTAAPSSEVSAAPPSASAEASASASASTGAAEPWASPDPNSLLGKIISSGKVRISTDPNYAPFSFYDTSTGQYVGFDNATAEEVVKRMNQILGTNLQIDWQTPNWDLITAGNWGGRWDMSIGSMSITKGREKVVDFPDPYYYDFGMIAIPKDSPVTKISDLDGKTICVGASTTYEQWLKGTLEIPGEMAPPPQNADITSLPTDNECVQAQAAGRKFDALVANENSLQNAINQGQPLKILDIPPPFIVQVAFALDKSGPDDKAMLALMDKIVADMHADGTLTALSNKYLGKDVTQKPS